jgi:DNA-binding GntR family transcriptional regulator
MSSQGQSRANKKSGNSSSTQAPPLAETTYQDIKRMLWVGELAPGQKLRYQDIAQRLSVSMTPIINALTRLENEGLVKSEARRGFFVPRLELREARELYELRAVLEPMLLVKAIPLITDDDLSHIKQLMEHHRECRDSIYTRERLYRDSRLHLAISARSDHITGHHYLRQVFDRLFLRYSPERLSSQRMSGAEQEHKALFKALEAGDEKGAVKIISEHIEKGRDHILCGLDQEQKFRNSFSPWD